MSEHTKMLRPFAVGGAAGPRVIVVGAGAGGIHVGVKLLERGLRNFVILEKADKLGGTWRDNRYPGLACDVPSHVYSYTHSPNPDWKRDFAEGPDIWRYFDKVATKFGVKDHMRFGQEVETADWLGDHWRLRTKQGEELKADIVIFACGRLHHPRYPEIEGLATFAGQAFHSSRWPEGLDITGKRVGLIGTGSTGAQLTSAIGGRAAALKIFQRTPQWVMPFPNPPIPLHKRILFKLFPHLLREHVRKAREALEAVSGNIIEHKGRDRLVAAGTAGLNTIKDPELRAKLQPNYVPGCKRLVMSPHFFEAIQRPGVELVTDKIARIEPEGVRTEDGKLHALDVLVLATGFIADAFMQPVAIRGAGGVTLAEMWADGRLNYRSVALPHMPNCFVVNGPYSPGGSTSVLDIIETHTKYILQCIDRIEAERVALAPREDVSREMLEEIRARGRTTIWATGGCKSWYLDKDGVPIYNPITVHQLRAQLAKPDFADFVVTPLGAQPAPAAA